MEYNSKVIAYWIILISIFILVLYLFYYISSESYQCMKSPLTYGASQLSTNSDNEISCTCNLQGSSNAIIFNRYNISTVDYSFGVIK